MENEMKTRSIRADEKVLDKFVQLSKEFGNQSECLAQLVSTWELHNAASALPEMATDITDIEAHLQALQSAYVHIIELNANADKRASVAYKAMLESKDKTIADYQQRLTEAENALTEATARAEAAQAKFTDIQDKLTVTEAERSRLVAELADKQLIIEELRERLPEAKERERLMTDLKASKDEAEKRAEKAERELEELKFSAEHDRKLAEVEIREAKSEVVEKYQAKISELFSTVEQLRNEIYTQKNQ